jgi:hypothetical protein
VVGDDRIDRKEPIENLKRAKELFSVKRKREQQDYKAEWQSIYLSLKSNKQLSLPPRMLWRHNYGCFDAISCYPMMIKSRRQAKKFCADVKKKEGRKELNRPVTLIGCWSRK